MKRKAWFLKRLPFQQAAKPSAASRFARFSVVECEVLCSGHCKLRADLAY